MEVVIMQYLPWIIGLAVAWVVLGLVLKLAKTVISIGCSLIGIVVVIVVLVNLF